MTQGRLLVTGGSGFIGTVAVDIALAAGYEVRNVDFRPPRKAEHGHLSRLIDIRHRDALHAEFTAFSPNYVLHLASDTDVSLKHLSEFTTTIGGTQNVIEEAEKLPELRRFVHVSTQYVLTPGLAPQGEQHWVPYTIYGEAKAETEKLMWASRLPEWSIMRPTIIWGPHHPSFAHLIWKYIAERKYMHPASSAPIMRTYGYVANVADQMISFVGRSTTADGRRTFYLGDAVMNYDEWVDAFSVPLTGSPARRIPVGLLKALGLTGEAMKKVGLKAPMDMGRYFRMTTAAPLDLSPTYEAVGTPVVPFSQGVAETLVWLRQSNPGLYRSLSSAA